MSLFTKNFSEKPAVDQKIAELGYPPELLSVYESAMSGLRNVMPQPVEEFVDPTTEFSSRGSTPDKPDPRRFHREAIHDGLDLEFRVRSVFQKLVPYRLDNKSAQVILDLSEGKTMITPLVEMNDRERVAIWEPIARSWWDNLGALQKQFTHEAEKVIAFHSSDSKDRERRYDGYRKLLHSLVKRRPFLLPTLYRSIETEGHVFVPDNFGEVAKKEWMEFLHEDWFVNLSQKERNRLAHISDRMTDYEEIQSLEKRRASLQEEISKLRGLRGMIRGLIQSDFTARKEKILKEYAELKEQILQLESSQQIDMEIDAVDAKLSQFPEEIVQDGGVLRISPEIVRSFVGSYSPAISDWVMKRATERASVSIATGEPVREHVSNNADSSRLILQTEEKLISRIATLIVENDLDINSIESDATVQALLKAYHAQESLQEGKQDAKPLSLFIETAFNQVTEELGHRGVSPDVKIGVLDDYIASSIDEKPSVEAPPQDGSDKPFYEDVSPDGSPIVYEKNTDGTVIVWDVSPELSRPLRRGVFTPDGVYTEKPEEMFTYSDAHGKSITVHELDQNIFIRPNGEVVRIISGKRTSIEAIGVVNSLKNIPREYIAKDGSVLPFDETKKRYMKPNGDIVQYDAATRQMLLVGRRKID